MVDETSSGAHESAVREKLEEKAWAEAKDSILTHRKQQASRVGKIVDAIESLKTALPNTSDDTLARWLRQVVGASADEAEVYLKFNAVLRNSYDVIVRYGVSMQVLHSLIHCHERVRSECLERIGRGEIVDVALVEELSVALRSQTLPLDEADLECRHQRFSRASQDLGRSVRIRLEEAATHLLHLMDDLYEKHVWWTDDGPCYDEDRTYRKDVRRIVRKASRTRKDFELLFGSEHPKLALIGELSARDDVAGSLAMSWHALQELEKGSFNALCFDFEAASLSVRPGIEYLAGKIPSAAPVRTPRSVRPVPPKSLTVLDISGGTGSATLGLETAGFRSMALHERNESLCRILEKNRPDWDVVAFPPASVFDQVFSNYSEVGVDLVTSSRTITPNAYIRSDDELRPTLEEVGRIIRLVRPRAFFFEVDPFVNPEDHKFRAGMEGLCSDLGYQWHWNSVDCSRLGLVNEGSREVVVGMRSDCAGRFSMPVVPNRPKRFLLEAIRDLLEPLIEQSREKEADIAWIDGWIANASGKFAPPFFIDNLCGRSSFKWGRLRIHIGVYPSAPKELSCLRGKTDRLKLSLQMVKRLQGIPDRWEIAGRDVSKNCEVETAVPPILARLAGLGIYSALTGEAVDIDAALASPILLPRYETGKSRFSLHPALVLADGVQPGISLRSLPLHRDATLLHRSLAAWEEQLDLCPGDRGVIAASRKAAVPTDPPTRP